MGLIFSVYNKFKLKNWSKYSSGKRQRIIEQVEKKLAKKLHRPVLPVVVETDTALKYYGSFEIVNDRRILNINLNLLTNPELRFHALETILHEGRHAYQYNIVHSGKIRFFEFKKKRWKQNYSGYITSSEDSLIYGMQPIERDAQKFAIKKMEKLAWRFKNEPDFAHTLKIMKYRYKKTEEDLKEKHGIFYNHAIKKKIRKKVDRRG